MLKLLGAKALTSRDTNEVVRVLRSDPVASCMVLARVEESGVEPRDNHGELWSRGGPASSLCFSGANLVPLFGTYDDLRSFAERALRSPRVCSSLVGRAELTLPLWDMLAADWGTPREVRAEQPLLALTSAPTAVDPYVRRVTVDELDVYLTAAVAMFIEEVGVDPRAGDGGRGYRRRIASLIAAGRAWARFEEGRVVFKAEVGSLSTSVGQIQGVWVHPLYRGRGLGTAGTASVAAAVVDSGRTASLYVNSFNVPARRAYERVGFERVATFSTVLLD
ncbi:MULTISPECIES: GNAT family N-acetyltransferase [Nocardiaceae]|jgi:predicted GNAT family acetyltransferase|uniref:GNAT family acetyltransferase n=1 Tax=Rhodococcoides corynebacterioides TaxID=53972 RepID=A0ABS2KSN5_9NOCA|nr:MULTISPECIES: GNAT family N-acetyltransferase [Rhodococcus]KQU34801.1 GCN5 family acetyltransferase [Rhodococcus sp. Leaf225]KQU45565.1 GCN5 family acetyltransferase [Rhodococcus sp. Leaf258]MBM7414932.1 putative GNAT family acetyltransferase [Rhodococcus corynebacterioides]MBP1117394.1 putative GNAT family acetyltransferase [Rhodococcus sp. PvP016]MBY6675788.1 GNAT family N-acetyltransferase [Rhodococcus sp. BP-332]